MPKLKRKRNPRSEAAMREAVRLLLKDEAKCWIKHGNGAPTEVEISSGREGAELLAIFDLRDCYRKRAPLTGVTKKLKAAIRSKRK
jgi:hypothetical protein